MKAFEKLLKSNEKLFDLESPDKSDKDKLEGKGFLMMMLIIHDNRVEQK